MLTASYVAGLLDGAANSSPVDERICIIPSPNAQQLRQSTQAAVDLRLGRWFLTFRHSRTPSLRLLGEPTDTAAERRVIKQHFVAFGETFYLHPRQFLLGATLEWIKLPLSIGGYITGKSSWARRGLIIETASGVHPGFAGCLTLEISNLGEVPLGIIPGMQICQIFFHAAQRDDGQNGLKGVAQSKSHLFGNRRPYLGKVSPDEIVNRLKHKL